MHNLPIFALKSDPARPYGLAQDMGSAVARGTLPRAKAEWLCRVIGALDVDWSRPGAEWFSCRLRWTLRDAITEAELEASRIDRARARVRKEVRPLLAGGAAPAAVERAAREAHFGQLSNAQVFALLREEAARARALGLR